MKLDPTKLYKLNKSKEDVVLLLNPMEYKENQVLFWKYSEDQKRFNSGLNDKDLRIESNIYDELNDALSYTQEELVTLRMKYPNVSKTRLDFDIAKIFHKNISIPKSVINNYDFWRSVTLFYFIEIVRWRWQNDPSDHNNWASNAKKIFNRSVGVRNNRIDGYRYWLLGEKLYCNQKGYYYLDALSDLVKSEQNLSVQNFILWILENKLTSSNNKVTKMFSEILFLEKKRYSENYIEDCIKRFNAFNSRLFEISDLDLFKREVCLIQKY